MMTEIIKTCCEKQELIVIKYDVNDEDSYLHGYIKQYNDNEIAVKCINERGQYDGYALLPISGIWRLNYGGKKIERICSLYERKKEADRDMTFKGPGLLCDMLEHAKANKIVVTLFTIDTEIEGYVNEYDDKTVHIEKIDEFGSQEGFCVTGMDKILYLFADTREGRNRDVLCRESYRHKIEDGKCKSIVKMPMRNNPDGLVDVLHYCYSCRFIISIFDYDSEQSEDGNWVGYLADYNKKEILFRHVSVNGEYDGYVWKSMDSVCGIAYDGKYENKMAILCEPMKQEYIRIKKGKNSLLVSLLKYAKKNKYIISMDTAYGAWTGFVKKCNKNIVKLKALDKYAQEDGIIAFNVDEIYTLRCDGCEERDVLTLYEGKKQ